MLTPVLKTCRAALQVRWLSTGTKATQFKVEMLEGKDAGIALFTMDRPEARNALGRQFMAELRDALDQVQYDRKVRVVILRSVVPNVFCAGADLKERLGMAPQEVRREIPGDGRVTGTSKLMPIVCTYVGRSNFS